MTAKPIGRHKVAPGASRAGMMRPGKRHWGEGLSQRVYASSGAAARTAYDLVLPRSRHLPRAVTDVASAETSTQLGSADRAISFECGERRQHRVRALIDQPRSSEAALLIRALMAFRFAATPALDDCAAGGLQLVDSLSANRRSCALEAILGVRHLACITYRRGVGGPQYFSIQFTTSFIISLRGILCAASYRIRRLCSSRVPRSLNSGS